MEKTDTALANDLVRQGVFRNLERAGVPRSGRWRDYERAKQVVKVDECVGDESIIRAVIRAICDWVRV